MRSCRARLWLVAAAMWIGGVEGAQAFCALKPFSQTRPQVEEFLRDATTPLRRFPAGGMGLVGAVRLLITADSRVTLEPMLKLIRVANAEQRFAIGRGLGESAQLCMNADPYTARDIAAKVRNLSDKDTQRGFTVALDGEAPYATAPKPTSVPPSTSSGLGTGPLRDPFRPIQQPSTPADPMRPIR